MYSIFSKKHQKLLVEGNWGVERESQRVTPEGDLALTPHPTVFGDKLKNKEITTDFSESQMELITPPFPTVEEVDHYLNYLHEEAEAGVKNELLWPLSMPPRLPEEELIPIASFDHTKEGQTAYLYRQGLAGRYGKKMQMISGIHYNFSFGEDFMKMLYREFGNNQTMTEFTDDLYFIVARNYLRYRWLLIYLFGASPTFEDTFNAVLREDIENIRKCCPECCNYFTYYATSLRASRFGYSNPVQAGYSVYYNSKEEYIQKIRALMSKKSRKYAMLLTQLNDKILQKDSEFYSPIRLKQITNPGESQIDALEQRGVKYVEIRILDVNPFEKTGISLKQMHFLQVFMLFCLFDEDKPIDNKELKRINKNHHLVALSGRMPKLMLYKLDSGKISLKKWGESIFEKLLKLAQLMDDEENGNFYSIVIQEEYQKLLDLSLLPSSKLLEEMSKREESFLDFGIRKGKEYRETHTLEVQSW